MGKLPLSGRGGRGRYRQARGPRKNERVRAPQVRVIGPDGKQLGLMSGRDAWQLAQKNGLDLVEISPNAVPPVCRILDYGKFMYEQSKREKDNKSSSSSHKLKEVKFRVRIDQHDYMTKLRHGEEFLGKGSKLKITLMFRGREMEHTDLGFDVVNRAIKDLEHIGHADTEPRLAGRNITVSLSPLPANKRKFKYNVEDEEDDTPPPAEDKQL